MTSRCLRNPAIDLRLLRKPVDLRIMMQQVTAAVPSGGAFRSYTKAPELRRWDSGGCLGKYPFTKRTFAEASSCPGH